MKEFMQFQEQIFVKLQNMGLHQNDCHSAENMKRFVELAGKAGYSLSDLLELLRSRGQAQMIDIVFDRIRATRDHADLINAGSSEENYS